MLPMGSVFRSLKKFIRSILGEYAMDLRQLRYFVNVAKSENFGRAAAQLNVAQSALSRHIKLLETELGVKLLDRHARGAEPTAAGKVLLKRATRLLRSIDETRQEVVSIGQGPAGHVNLAIPSSVSQLFAAPLINVCQRELPNVTLKLSEGWTGDIQEWLLNGHSDLGIIYSSQVDDRFYFKPIITESLELIISAENCSLNKRSSYSLNEVSKMALTIPPNPHGLRKVIDAAFAEHNLTPHLLVESQVWSVIKKLVRSGEAHAILPSSEVAADIRRGHMKSIPILDPVLKRTLGMAISRGSHMSPSVQAVFHLVGKESSKWSELI